MTSRTKRFAIVFAVLVGAAAVIGVAAWRSIVISMAPRKRPSPSRSAAAIAADSVFWRTLHSGVYDQLPHAIEVLTRAYVASPGDAVTASHVAWLHIWRMAEASRLDTAPASITDDIVLSRKYFQEAVALDPADARKLGFLGGSMVAEGTVDRNEKLIRRGYYTMRDAIEAWPEFNLFTAGYVMSRTPSGSPQFHEALEWQWRTLDLCAEARIDRENPDYRRPMALETQHGVKRACWNSWIAPHNFEGFFLNMGDMLVKSGDWKTAQKVYAIARLSRTYAAWPYTSVLEERIRQARENVAVFNAAGAGGRTGLMIRSAFACMACHQESGPSSVATGQAPPRLDGISANRPT
jgi:hypothetical protein